MHYIKMKVLYITLIILLVFFSGCIFQSWDVSETSTTEDTIHSDSTTTTTSQSPATSTTILVTTTTLDECSLISGELNQSVCYFNKALSVNNKSICDFIPHTLSRESCLNSVGVKENPTSRIYGRVVRKIGAVGLENLRVSVYSTTRDKVYNTQTISDGTYSVQVHGGDSYAVKVEYEGKNLTQYVNARRNWEHQLDYVIA